MRATSNADPASLTFHICGDGPLRHDALQLVYRNYRELGILEHNASGQHDCPQLYSNTATTIAATIGNVCVGTISAYLDHPEHRLPLDGPCGKVLDEARAGGGTVLEVGLLACLSEVRERSRMLIFDLMRYATWFGDHLGVTHAVVGVHPHHVPFYTRGLGFEVMGEEQSYDSLGEAPLVPLCLHWQKQKLARKPPVGTRYFLDHPVEREAFGRQLPPAMRPARAA